MRGSMHILYPSDYFARGEPDEQFRPEAEAFAAAGVGYSTINTDELAKAKAVPKIESGTTVLYRGWMLNADNYGQLVDAIEADGALPLTNSEAYLRVHHIPNWCRVLQDLSPETVVLPLGTDFESELRVLGWEAFFVKDYVKSLKTSVGSVITEPDQIGHLVEEMEKYRGEIEGGLCVRRFEKFLPETEVRYFVLGGKPYAPTVGDIPPIVEECAKRIDSPFFSIDVAKRSDGVDRIVEIGDGQVSDLVGWSISRFVEVFSK